ncbi:DNA-directed RNA polymerase I subunit RPA34 isoform X2 [Takifugu rubripes]|uniref:DNA-directed RNA polymerase I subunit RPA34 isoform X2 n=1 Tax=Takifugu rubripes TaxID=31033 RepID=UPI0005D13CA5|nr:DNA-directed RNA polymerase I subunit RPA34 isoform X2 [Takifugu rubripes]|eukprot:XP_011606986.1 PREDICTED: DNA-directed RNA polymerase I subunit RPA34 [Takifugu rubripes]
MPKDVSSSSEGESENPPTESQPKQLGKTTRYECPVDFVSVSYKPCKSTFRKKLKKSNKELWLIKAPAAFDPECFQGVQVPLSGLQTVKVHATKGGANSERDQQIYNVRASAHGTSELYLLTSDKNSSERVGCAPTFSGLLTVCESYGYEADRPLQVIPAAPPPSIPSELKHRFPLTQMASTQTCVAKDETDGLDQHLMERMQEEEEGRKKKKKRKREKDIKMEPEEEMDISRVNENVAEIQAQVKTEMPFQEGGVLEEKKRKKKKKKKDSEQDEVEELMGKTEPVDSWNNDVAEGSNKKKKKKKKSKMDAD